MRVDQLLVDPVAAALRQLVHVQLASREHHLPHRAVDLIAVDVDVGEVVVRADLLDLAQRVLQRAPVPEADVLQRRLVVRGVERFDARFRRERALREAVQAEREPRHLDVVRDVRRFAHELVRFDDEAVDVRADQRKGEIADCRGRDRECEPARARCGDRIDERQGRAGNERDRDDEQARERDVRVGVRDAGEGRAIGEQRVVASDPRSQRDREQKQCERDRESTPRRRAGLAPSAEQPRAAGDGDKEDGDGADDHGKRQQPAAHELPRRQGEQVEGDRPAEDRIDGRAGG